MYKTIIFIVFIANNLFAQDIGSTQHTNLFAEISGKIADISIPLIILLILVIAFIKKIKVYEEFIEGAKEGFQTAVRIIPFLVGILTAISMFRASGAMEFFINLIKPATDLIGLLAEALPMALLRPLSGGGAQGVMAETMKTHGADSFIGLLVSTMQGSTETTFYVLAVYFGSVSIKKSRHAVVSGLIGDFFGLMTAFIICKIVFL